MKQAYLLIFATALFSLFSAHLPAIAVGASNSSYTLLYSSNVSGEVEPCG